MAFTLRSEENVGEREEEGKESGYKKGSGRGRIKISQRQLTIVKSHPLPRPPIAPFHPSRDGRRSGVTDPPLSPTKQNSLPSPISHPRLGNVR